MLPHLHIMQDVLTASCFKLEPGQCFVTKLGAAFSGEFAGADPLSWQERFFPLRRRAMWPVQLGAAVLNDSSLAFPGASAAGKAARTLGRVQCHLTPCVPA